MFVASIFEMHSSREFVNILNNGCTERSKSSEHIKVFDIIFKRRKKSDEPNLRPPTPCSDLSKAAPAKRCGHGYKIMRTQQAALDSSQGLKLPVKFQMSNGPPAWMLQSMR